MTTMSTLPDLPYAVAYRHLEDLRAAAERRRHLPPRQARQPRPRLRRTRTVLRWLWEGQLALVPPVFDPVTSSPAVAEPVTSSPAASSPAVAEPVTAAPAARAA